MATNDDWLARTAEPTLDPELPICDPHHHLSGASGRRRTKRPEELQ